MIRSVTLDRDGIDAGSYPFSIPAIGSLTTLELHPHVTLLAGENGSGKSTLVEAIAVAAALHVVRDARPIRDGWFLRAESFSNIATHIEQLGVSGYGDASLHEQSHGESFLSLVLERFGDRGLYILDEPEAALSVRGVLALIRRGDGGRRADAVVPRRPRAFSALPLRRRVATRARARGRAARRASRAPRASAR